MPELVVPVAAREVSRRDDAILQQRMRRVDARVDDGDDDVLASQLRQSAGAAPDLIRADGLRRHFVQRLDARVARQVIDGVVLAQRRELAGGDAHDTAVSRQVALDGEVVRARDGVAVGLGSVHDHFDRLRAGGEVVAEIGAEPGGVFCRSRHSGRENQNRRAHSTQEAAAQRISEWVHRDSSVLLKGCRVRESVDGPGPHVLHRVE